MRALEVEMGGIAAAATKAQMSPSQWGNLREGAKDSKTGRRRGMRKETARRIEEAFEKPVGWLDTDHLGASHTGNTFMGGSQSGGPTSNVLSLPATKADISDVVIPQFETGGAMGFGLVLREQPGIIKQWTVSADWLNQNVHRVTSHKNLAIVTGFGPSMQPVFNPGDPLLIDCGVKRADSDGVYFFRVGDEGFVKQLQRIPTEAGMILRAKSYNTLYDPFDITANMDFEVFGRVVKVWKGEEF